MPLHPEARALLDRLEALGDPPTESSTPAEVRDVDANGIATRLYRLRTVGVAAETMRYDGTIHGFFSLGELLSDGRQALTQAARTLAERLEPSGLQLHDRPPSTRLE